MIYLSASGIKDFLACSQRYKFRTTDAEESDTSDSQLIGRILHEFLEKEALTNKEIYLSKLNKEAEQFEIPAHKEKFLRCGTNFLEMDMQQFLTLKDEIEFSFKIKFSNNVSIVGKMDRITPSGVVIDWKTSTKTPSNIDNDIQFLLYYYAYFRIYNSYPSKVLYVNLHNAEIIGLKITNNYNYLLDEIIPGIAKQIKSNNFYRNGIFTNSCFFCNFKRFCREENELHS